LKRGRRYLIGYVGVIGRQEGIEYLLHAIRHIVQVRKRTDIHFAIVGTGPHWEEVRHLSSTLRIEEFVTFTGRLSDDQLLAVLATSDLCVNPDEVNELNDLSTMNKVVEYMALGKPIVQFETREGRYSAQDAAAYAAPNDPTDLAEKILTLLARPARRQAMGEYARTRFRTVLAWDHQIPRLLDAYAAVAKPSVLAAPQEEAPVWVVRRSLAATESASAPAVGQRSAERTPAPLQTGSEP
jgi:glycosyltransferase involved in cell wall biosynthesis